MFTTCPKCSLKLVVTAADLRVAQGYVRCGRCSNVFNALAGLSDEQQAVLAREQADAQPQSAREQTRPQPQAEREQTLREPTAARPPSAAPSERECVVPAPAPPPTEQTAEPAADEPMADTALEFDATSTDVSDVFVEPREDDDPTGTFESIVLRSEDAPPDEEGASGDSGVHELELDLEELVSAAGRADAASAAHGSPPQAAPMEPSASAAPDDAAHDSSAFRESSDRERASAAPVPRLVSPAPAPGHTSPAPTPAPGRASPAPAARAVPRAHSGLHEPLSLAGRSALSATSDEADERGARTRRLIDRALRIGSALLALTLLLQIIHHERARLAGVPWLGGPLAAAYSALGMPLEPHWDVGAYEVRQLGAVAGPRNPGALTVRASVKNTAPRAQPLPLLRVTMQDRFGNRIAARDVPPSAYLPSGSASRTELAAGQRIDAEVAFVDPGPDAVGFEIDACLKLPSGRIACANDSATHPP